MEHGHNAFHGRRRAKWSFIWSQGATTHGGFWALLRYPTVRPGRRGEREGDVNVLTPNVAASRLALLFVAAIIKHGKSRYTYGYKWNLERMVGSTVRLPSTVTGDPDWEYMDAHMRGLPFSGLVVAAAAA